MDLLEQIRGVVGETGLIVGEEVGKRPADWTGRTSCKARAVVRPGTTQELSEVMKLCHAARQPVVPAGGLTGLVQGARANGNEVQISFERMRKIESVDPVGRTMTVQAGVPLQAVHEAAAEEGLMYGVDLGARGSCTIGGNISTNAGGNTVIRYGMTRENVLGLEAVLADGTIVSSMNALLKNNAAYDLKQLFIGSEGTLGLVTRAVLRLQPAPTSEATAMLALDGFENLTRLFTLVGGRFAGMLSSFEVMWNNYYQVIGVQSGRHKPPLVAGHDFYIVVEITGNDPEADEALFTEVLGTAIEAGIAADAVIASSKAQRDAIWGIREDIEGLVHAFMPGVAFDVSLPIIMMDDYISGLDEQLHQACGEDARMAVFGHIGDSNLHVMVSPRPCNSETIHQAKELVYKPLAALGGSVSAEHGIGLDKLEWLPLSRNSEEIALMRQIKTTLDPHNLLNPGKVLPEA
ncbi:MAG: FAD-binding oxidoreductase [Hyphomonadaceae bacterium]|nr:FAD-binding oxidoreductase [Hyphomonadaceae bacterium]